MPPVPRPGQPSASTRVCGTVIRVLRQVAAHTAPVDRCRGALRRAEGLGSFAILFQHILVACGAVQVALFKFHAQAFGVQFMNQPLEGLVRRKPGLKKPELARLQRPGPTTLAAVRALEFIDKPGIFLELFPFSFGSLLQKAHTWFWLLELRQVPQVDLSQVRP
jgi:hypothetical protein